jgi:hypothetical protein
MTEPCVGLARLDGLVSSEIGWLNELPRVAIGQPSVWHRNHTPRFAGLAPFVVIGCFATDGLETPVIAGWARPYAGGSV